MATKTLNFTADELVLDLGSGERAYNCGLANRNANAKENIPPYSKITNVTYKAFVKETTKVTIGKADFSVYFMDANGSKIGDYLYNKTSCVPKGEYLTVSIDVTPYVLSSVKDAGCFSYNNATHIRNLIDSSLIRSYTIYFSVDWTYTLPTYKISLSASGGGTVSGAGTYDVGTSAMIKATPNAGYKFVKWSDGNTSATRTITRTTSDISANVTNLSYTAYFELDKVYVTYDSIFNFRRWADNNLTSWDLIEVSNITDTGFTGKALVDDAYTLECRPLIQVEAGKTYTFECATTGGGFEFFIFNCNSSGAWADFTYGNTNKFNFTPSTSYISIRCDVVGTGTVVNFSNFKMYPADCSYMSGTVAAADRSDCNSWSMPTPTREGYTFKGWNTKPDGSGTTYTSASAFPSSDLVLYSQWELQKINKIYVGTSQPKAIYVGTTPVKAVYVGTTKVYG